MAGSTRDKYASLYDRLVANTKVAENGCWEWTAAVGKRRHREYPRINVYSSKLKKRESKRPHRVMIEEFYDVELTPDIHGDHKCLNTRCICPWHLEPVTGDVNLARRFDRAVGVPVILPKRSARIEASIDHWFAHGGIPCAPDAPPPF